MTTSVVNIYHLPKEWEQDAQYVYIGRRKSTDGPSGYFGNPFVLMKGESRGSTLEQYRKYFYNRLETDPEFKARILALKGKTLVCFCRPKAGFPAGEAICHGQIIQEYLDNDACGG
jgi:hypothetical protein